MPCKHCYHEGCITSWLSEVSQRWSLFPAQLVAYVFRVLQHKPIACVFRFFQHKPRLVEHSACPHPLHGAAQQMRLCVCPTDLSNLLIRTAPSPSVTSRPNILGSAAVLPPVPAVPLPSLTPALSLACCSMTESLSRVMALSSLLTCARLLQRFLKLCPLACFGTTYTPVCRTTP